MRNLTKETGKALKEKRSELAAELVEREFRRHPELIERYGPIGRAKSLQDADYHLLYLSQALEISQPSLFSDYVAWCKVMLAQRGVLPQDLMFHLECMAEVVEELVPETEGQEAATIIRMAISGASEMPEDLPTFLREGEPLAPLAYQYFEALRRGDRRLACNLVLNAVNEGTPIRDIYLYVFQTTQHEIGRLWQTNRMSVAQEHFCTAATQLIMSQLYPRIFATESNGLTLVASCVEGDLHELGIRMVADFFAMKGWDTYYLGANTPIRGVVETVIERKADLLAISATMTYHVDAVKRLIDAVRSSPECADVKILAGGYPFSQNSELWRAVGADGSATDADGAVETGITLLNGR